MILTDENANEISKTALLFPENRTPLELELCRKILELLKKQAEDGYVSRKDARYAMYLALKELVALKEMKDRGLSYDDKIEYMNRKPKAWAVAKALLSSTSFQDPD